MLYIKNGSKEGEALIPARCGNWGHIPNAVSSQHDPYILLAAMGCRIGRQCRKHPGWWHFHPPRGWALLFKNDGMWLNNEDGCSRARLLNGEPPTLIACTFHQVAAKQELYKGFTLITVEAVDQLTLTPLCRLYHFPQVNSPRGIFNLTVEMLTRLKPQARDPFAYWENPHMTLTN